MAGHSQFKNIMYRKGAQDAKRARLFAKFAREIFVAAKSGLIDPHSNPRLRAALASARSANMPKDNIDRALKKAAGTDDQTVYEEVRYEGYGVGGIALIIEALTDNRNRTASDIRSVFTKYGGHLGETGSVGFQFERIGYISFLKKERRFDFIFEVALESGAEDVIESDELFEITCRFEDFSAVRDALSHRLSDLVEAKVLWKPLNEVACDFDHTKTLVKMIELLEDHDDVQHVYTNAAFKEEDLDRL